MCFQFVLFLLVVLNVPHPVFICKFRVFLTRVLHIFFILSFISNGLVLLQFFRLIFFWITHVGGSESVGLHGGRDQRHVQAAVRSLTAGQHWVHDRGRSPDPHQARSAPSQGKVLNLIFLKRYYVLVTWNTGSMNVSAMFFLIDLWSCKRANRKRLKEPQFADPLGWMDIKYDLT